MSSTIKSAVACITKNSAPRISEWIAYQLAFGFDTVILLNNISTDDTAQRARNFTNAGYDVRVFDWNMTGPTYQIMGFEWTLWRHRFEFDFIACYDDDEFPVLPSGQSINDYLATIPDSVDSVAWPWAMFGSNGHETHPEGLVIEAYTRRSAPGFVRARHIKSMVRPLRVRTENNVHAYDVDNVVTLDGLPLEPRRAKFPFDLNLSSGQLNHYFTRSRQCWDGKLLRGYHDTTRQPEDFHIYDLNEIEDTSALQYADRVRDILGCVKKANAEA